MLPAIPVERIQAQPGTFHTFLFENPLVGIAWTLYYDITIPLAPFHSGLSYEEQPVHTAFSLSFLNLPVSDWRTLDGLNIASLLREQDGSVYLGAAHNSVEIRSMQFTRQGPAVFHIDAVLDCDFESQGVGQNATVEITTDLTFTGLELSAYQWKLDQISPEELYAFVTRYIQPEAYAQTWTSSDMGLCLPPI